MPNSLYYGDNLQVLRDHIPDESVDLVYLDPPFNSNASYNVLFREKSGEESPAQIKAFTDTWEWTLETERTFEEDIILNPRHAPGGQGNDWQLQRDGIHSDNAEPMGRKQKCLKPLSYRANSPRPFPNDVSARRFSVPELGLVLIQGSTIFLAFSILLGRIYFLEYFGTLGIPTNDVQINVIDYSVISPDVAILGVGIMAMWIVYFWRIRGAQSTGSKQQNLIYGVIFLGAGVALPFIVKLLDVDQETGFGVFGNTKRFVVGPLNVGRSIPRSCH